MPQNPLPDPEAHARLMADAMGLPLDKADLAEVARNVALAFRLAASFMDYPLPDDAEPAAIFAA
ncbi:MAG: DUF4089 domain-containing protein, partial [Methylobacterium sp.]|nr:DUF4089 domain-containing protein [Methylobacterium sp.]